MCHHLRAVNLNRRFTMVKRLTYDYVKSFFAAEGFTLLRSLTPKEELSRSRFSYICPKGHKGNITWFCFRHVGSRCLECSGQLKRHSEIEECFASNGYNLLSQYKNAHSKLDFECPNGHLHNISWTRFQSGGRCAKCAGQIITHEEVLAKFEQEGYQLLSQYKNTKTKLRFICPNEHCRQSTLAQWNRGQRCRDCAIYGYRGNIPGRIYYLKFEHIGKPYYKLGVTNRTVKERYKDERKPYIVLMDLYYKDGSIPFNKETVILRKNKQFQYKGLPFLKSGNSELFTKDILGLDSPQLSLCEVFV